MTSVEDRLRETLHDMADEVQPVALLPRLQRRSTAVNNRRRLAVAAVAAGVAGAVVAAGVVVLDRIDRPSVVEPVQRPPKVFRLSDTSSAAPGRADVAVNLAPTAADDSRDLYLHAPGRARAVRLTPSEAVPRAWSQQMSPDGTRVVRQNDSASGWRMELVDLRTGRVDDLREAHGICPAVSPDNSTVASYSDKGVQDAEVRLLDVADGSSRVLRTIPSYRGYVCGGLGWSPAGDLLAIRHRGGTAVVDLRGREVLGIPDGYLTNSSMSWSPDGEQVIVYDESSGRFLAVGLRDGHEAVLPKPRGGLEPLGWAGEQVVWLVGQPGQQSLVTTDVGGGNAQTWIRLEVADRAVDTVQWSRRLSGAAG